MKHIYMEKNFIILFFLNIIYRSFRNVVDSGILNFNKMYYF